MRVCDGVDVAEYWRPPIDGVEVLHARFARHEYPRHAHDATVVALMDSGAAAFRYGGENHVAPAGSVFFINAGAVHTGCLADPDGYRYRVLYLGSLALDQLAPRWHSGSSHLILRDVVVWDRELATLLHRTHSVLAAGGPLSLQEELLLSVSEYLLSRYAETRLPAAAADGGHRAVAVAQEYLESHVAADVPLRDLAAIASSSPHRLVRMFTSKIGMPPHAYQMQLRVRAARRLLAAGVPAASVAVQAGFYDQAHLTRAFKRYTAVTPHQYRQCVERSVPRSA